MHRYGELERGEHRCRVFVDFPGPRPVLWRDGLPVLDRLVSTYALITRKAMDLAAMSSMNLKLVNPVCSPGCTPRVARFVDAAVIPQQFVHAIPHRAPTAVLLDGVSFRI